MESHRATGLATFPFGQTFKPNRKDKNFPAHSLMSYSYHPGRLASRSEGACLRILRWHSGNWRIYEDHKIAICDFRTDGDNADGRRQDRSEEHTSELQSLRH